MNLTQKYIPLKLDDVVGHDKTIKALKEHARKNDWPQVILLEGITGTGKTTLARIIAKTILCKHKDKEGNPCNDCYTCKDIDESKFSYGTSYEWDARDIKLEQVEQIKDICDKQSMMVDHIVQFFDEFQFLLPASVEKMHKILEKDYHGTRTFILGSMENGAIKRSLKSRTEKYKLHNIDPLVIGKKLIEIAQLEGYKIDNQEKVNVLIAIANFADGSMRDGLHYLQSVLTMGLWDSKDLAKELGIVTNDSLINMCGMLIDGNYKVFEYEWTPEMLISVRRMLMNVYKIQKGIELPSYIANQTGGLTKLPDTKIRFALNKMIESLGLPYINNEVVELTLLDILENNSINKPTRQTISQDTISITLNEIEKPKTRQRA